MTPYKKRLNPYIQRMVEDMQLRNLADKATDVLKYLARYMSGGPISDRRLISDEDGHVTFWARSKEKSDGNKSQPFHLRGTEFVRRWSMHILPKGYTRSRSYGGFHGTKRKDYLQCCRELLGITPNDDTSDLIELPEPTLPTCARCEVPMTCIEQKPRPSWRDIFERDIYADPQLYSPQHHIHFRLPAAYPSDKYG
jgi:hypothetical protein